MVKKETLDKYDEKSPPAIVGQCSYCGRRVPFRTICDWCHQQRLEESVFINCRCCRAQGKYVYNRGWSTCIFCRGTRQILVHKDEVNFYCFRAWEGRNRKFYHKYESIVPWMDPDWNKLYGKETPEERRNNEDVNEFRKPVVRPLPEPKKPLHIHEEQWVSDTENLLFEEPL